MKRMAVYVANVAVLFLMLGIMGCGKGSVSGTGKMELPELGVSVDVPGGWKLDKENPQMCARGYYTGLIMAEDLEGKDFEQSVNQMSEEFGAKIISKTPLAINGYQAFRVRIDDLNGNVILRLYIHKDNKLIWIAFIASENDFQKYEDNLLKSLESVTIE